MQIIPVLDLKAGQAVHAVRGERERYIPVQGLLGSGHRVVALATAYRDRLGCHTCYVADLDAIAGLPGHIEILGALVAEGLSLWVDAGVSEVNQALPLIDLGVTKIIVGSESLHSATQLLKLSRQLPPNRLALSVDLRNGLLQGPPDVDNLLQLVSLAAQAGWQDVILLDLARVGAAAGPPLDLLALLHPLFPDLAFYVGGGVRHAGDLERLAQAGAAGALVATALHQGDLTAADIQAYS